MKALEDFGKKIDSSADVRKEADGAYDQLGNALTQAHTTYFNHIVEIGKKNGFDFTAEEVAEKFGKAAGELTDEQLDAVAGGVGAARQHMLRSIVRLPGREILAGT